METSCRLEAKFKFVCLVLKMEASEEEWVNSQNYQGKGRTLCNRLIASMVFGVNPLFIGGLHIISKLIDIFLEII